MNSVCNEAKMPKEEKQRKMKIQKDRWLGHRTPWGEEEHEKTNNPCQCEKNKPEKKEKKKNLQEDQKKIS